MLKMIQYNYKVGDEICFKYNGSIQKAIITRVNQKTLSIQFGMMKGRIGYGLVLGSTTDSYNQIEINTECPKLERSEFNTQKDLEDLMQEVKEEFAKVFSNLFNEQEKEYLRNVKIFWGNQYTYRRLGTYTYRHHNTSLNNTIRMSKSLKNAPKYVLKATIYHELLHIHFHEHGKVFRTYEARIPRYQEADEYVHELCIEIRNNGIHRIKQLPIPKREVPKKEVNQPKKELTLEERFKQNQQKWKNRKLNF